MPIRGLKDNTIKTSIAALNAALADAVALRMAIKQAHWTVKGPHFIAIHELFDTVAGRSVAMIEVGHEGSMAVARRLGYREMRVTDDMGDQVMLLERVVR